MPRSTRPLSLHHTLALLLPLLLWVLLLIAPACSSFLYAPKMSAISDSTSAASLTFREANEESKDSFTLLLLIVLLIVCFVSAYILRQLQSKWKILHETGAAILFGAIMGAFIRFFAKLERLQSIVQFDSEFFMLILLPPIIFESGYNMRRSNFFNNIGRISVMAFVGTLISAGIFGGLLYVVVSWGLTLPLSLLECFIFGSLISATDPVSVLAIFKDLGVNKNLYASVFGESILNDAIAIVLFRALSTTTSKELSIGTLLNIVLEFTVSFAGSFAVGVTIGLLSSLLFKYTQFDRYHTLELVLLVLYSYSSYLLADGLGLSGIVAILFCGVVMAHYTYHNLSPQAQKFSTKLFKVMASLSEMFVFAYLGLALFSFDQVYDIGLIFFSVLFCLASRLFNIFPLSLMINIYQRKNPKRQIPLKEQFVMWFAGLRGAMAFALSLDTQTEHALSIHTTTLFIVLLTVMVMGGATGPLLILLDVKPQAAGDEEEVDEVDSTFWMRLDRRYIKPMLIKRVALPHYYATEMVGQDFETTEMMELEMEEDPMGEDEDNNGARMQFRKGGVGDLSDDEELVGAVSLNELDRGQASFSAGTTN